MKKIVCFTLALLLLFSTATVFSACRKKNQKTFETADWQAYVVVYNDASFSPLKDAVGDLTTRLSARIGDNPARESTDEEGDVETDDFEIVIGDTDRAATKTAKSRLSGDGWCILPTGKKIVVYGTTHLLTVQAVRAFIEAYLPEGGSGAAPADLHEEIHDGTAMLTLLSEHCMVFDADLDDDPKSKYNKDLTDAYDYPVVAARQLRGTLAAACGCTESDIKLRKDTDKVKDYEIVVGVTDRPVSKELLASLGNVDRFGFLVRDGKIAVAGFNDVTLHLAVSLLTTCIEDAKRQTGSAKLPDGLLLVKKKSSDNWFTDFPLPDYEGLTLSASEDVGQSSVEYFYTGAGVSTANYEDYCEKLTAAGFELYTANAIEGSIYRTYFSEEKAAMLHVTYAAFAHAAEQNVKLYQPAIRIVSSPTGNNPLTKARLIEKEAFSPVQTFEKVTDTRITALQFNRDIGNFGMGYIITLEDGSFLMIDGGAAESGSQDHVRIYRVLRDLYYLAHGYQSNETDHRIRLAAWYLTHAHGDHSGSFTRFATTYGAKIDAEKMIANLVSDSESYNSYNPNNRFRDQIGTVLNSFKTRMAYYKVKTGWKFYIRNVELEVLFTHEDLCPERLYYFNDSSTAIRMTIYNTDGRGNRNGTPTTVLWVGDMFQKGCQFMRATYGNYLKSDMGQVAHHGYQGCDWEFYQLVAPTVMWWPAAFSEAFAWSKVSSANATYKINGYVLYRLQSVEYFIFCDLQNITVTITKDGPQMALEQLYNADSTDHDVTAYGTREAPAGIIRSDSIRSN